jgi:hypothetical protein
MLSVALAIVGAAIYVYQALRGEVRPHPLSWFVFGVLSGVGYEPGHQPAIVNSAGGHRSSGDGCNHLPLCERSPFSSLPLSQSDPSGRWRQIAGPTNGWLWANEHSATRRSDRQMDGRPSAGGRYPASAWRIEGLLLGALFASPSAEF